MGYPDAFGSRDRLDIGVALDPRRALNLRPARVPRRSVHLLGADVGVMHGFSRRRRRMTIRLRWCRSTRHVRDHEIPAQDVGTTVVCRSRLHATRAWQPLRWSLTNPSDCIAA